MNTLPDINVAQRIIERLRQAGLLDAENLRFLSNHLSVGDVSETQWRIAVERDIRDGHAQDNASNGAEVLDGKTN